ncbi:hypothetical protein [Arthrobacter globiformis]|nr:hypothetical protein [Arthrobacter globiformis]MDQ0619222.1 hypothetical protein [Arthrobacter globiformis]
MSDQAVVEATAKEACRDEGAQAVADKLLELMSPTTAMMWLKGYEGHLGG